ncbi:unnamed protein product [Amaranthus hypochondriacus]
MVEPAKARGPGRPRKTEVQQKVVVLAQLKDNQEVEPPATVGKQNEPKPSTDLVLKDAAGLRTLAPETSAKEAVDTVN